ncbi:hypothetical protein AAHE18_17G116700 [Arachis hypogaea]
MVETEMNNQAKPIFIPSPVLSMKLSSTPSSDSYIKSVFSSQPHIKHIDVPEVELPPHELLLKFPLYYSILSSYPNSDSKPVIALMVDFVCTSMIDVGKELSIPSYLYMPTNAGFLSLMISLQTRISKLVPSSVLTDALLNKDGGYVACYKLAQSFKGSKGIINTFSEIEQHSIDALSKGQTPPIYAIGPLIDLKGHPNSNVDQAQCGSILKWLDEQPPCSVIFLCFGSRGSFGPYQTREIALALQHCGLCVLRQCRGMICEWAPQVEILAHKGSAVFVSHCGWNSISESLWFGMPILTWPIYAEQQLNAFWMVKEFGMPHWN